MKCVICGKEFIPIAGPQKTCSVECREILYKRNKQKYYETHRVKNRIRKCRYCGKEFESKRDAWLCSDECRRKWRNLKRTESKKRNYKPKIRFCVICGKEFTGRPHAKTCSPECSYELKLRQRRQRYAELKK